MTTLVCFHAHPDDEAISTGGTMARAAAEGHRVVVVFATRGEVGEVDDGFLDDGETLAERRTAEVHAAAEVLGVSRVEFLGYRDSGMMGEPTNDHPDCFWQVDVDDAASRLAAILRAEGAGVFTCYDAHGTYGHPDHIQVHRVGRRAADLAGVPRVYEATANRDETLRNLAEAVAEAEGSADGADLPDPAEMAEFGTPAAQIDTAVDVARYATSKRRALAAHRSQIGDDSFFVSMSDDDFARVFGTEWFIRVRPDGPVRPAGAPRHSSLFADDLVDAP